MLAGIKPGTKEFHDCVLHVTFRTWTDVSGDRSNEFFNIDEATSQLNSPQIEMNPYQATLLAGWRTRFGELPLYEDAEFLVENVPTKLNHHYWAFIEGYWSKYSQEHTWTNAMRPTALYSDVTTYFNTIEHNLNMAVYYCATVLNYVLNHVGYTDCDCGSSSGQNPNPPLPDGVKDKTALGEGLKSSLKEFEGLFFFNFMGLMATAIAFALLNKVDVIEEFILL